MHHACVYIKKKIIWLRNSWNDLRIQSLTLLNQYAYFSAQYCPLCWWWSISYKCPHYWLQVFFKMLPPILKCVTWVHSCLARTNRQCLFIQLSNKIYQFHKLAVIYLYYPVWGCCFTVIPQTYNFLYWYHIYTPLLCFQTFLLTLTFHFNTEI